MEEGDARKAAAAQPQQSDTSNNPDVNAPSASFVEEVISLLKSGSDTLTAQGCQKVRKVGRLYATEILESAVFPELLIMLRREPTSTTASNVLSALVALSSKPEGRQRVSMAGLMQIAYSIVAAGEYSKPATLNALALMMNLCADRLNRHLAGQVGIMEQLVGLLRADAPFRAVEHALGALSNLVVADTEQKTRFAKLGGITQLCRVHVRRGDKSETTAFRSKMLLVELLHTPALADETAQALAEHHIKLAASAEDEAAAGRGAPPLPPLDTGAPPASASATTEQSSRSMTPMSSSIATTDAGGDNQRL